MNRRTQGLLLAFTGAVLVRLSLGDAYLQYVTSWMRWPILASGVLLVLLAVGPVTDQGPGRAGTADGGPQADHGHRHGGVPVVTWLLLLPGLVAFVIAPPALGSYLAERRADEVVTLDQPVVAPVAEADVVPLRLQEFIYRAQDGGRSIEGRTVDLSGFVSYDEDGGWYVTTLAIGCCAADAVSYRVEVRGGGPRPPRDQWVTVTGVHVAGTGRLDGSGTKLVSTPAVEAVGVVSTPTPAQTYS